MEKVTFAQLWAIWADFVVSNLFGTRIIFKRIFCLLFFLIIKNKLFLINTIQVTLSKGTFNTGINYLIASDIHDII